MPLSFVIARYFAYAFAAVATAWLASFMVLSVAINAGFVYEASWGPANAREVADYISFYCFTYKFCCSNHIYIPAHFIFLCTHIRSRNCCCKNKV